MTVRGVVRGLGVGLTAALFAAGSGLAETSPVQLFPANGAKGVNPDTHLVVTFAAAPTIGRSGQIRIYDAADHTLVDTLDMSVPAGPGASGGDAGDRSESAYSDDDYAGGEGGSG
jgi:hypothetical protein